MRLKITFHLDGSGVYYDPNEPIHLDALLSWSLLPRLNLPTNIGRDDPPGLVPLDLKKFYVGDKWVWSASALFPDGPQGEDLQFWRKRFRSSRADLSKGAPNLKNGTYRDWNSPVPLLLTTRMVAYANGGRSDIRRLLKDVRYLGKKRAHGHGKVVAVDVDEIEHDYSVVREGHAMRWLPDDSGARLVRLAPPYWNRVSRERCCEVGDPVELPHCNIQ